MKSIKSLSKYKSGVFHIFQFNPSLPWFLLLKARAFQDTRGMQPWRRGFACLKGKGAPSCREPTVRCRCVAPSVLRGKALWVAGNQQYLAGGLFLEHQGARERASSLDPSRYLSIDKMVKPFLILWFKWFLLLVFILVI